MSDELCTEHTTWSFLDSLTWKQHKSERFLCFYPRESCACLVFTTNYATKFVHFLRSNSSRSIFIKEWAQRDRTVLPCRTNLHPVDPNWVPTAWRTNPCWPITARRGRFSGDANGDLKCMAGYGRPCLFFYGKQQRWQHGLFDHAIYAMQWWVCKIKVGNQTLLQNGVSMRLRMGMSGAVGQSKRDSAADVCFFHTTILLFSGTHSLIFPSFSMQLFYHDILLFSVFSSTPLFSYSLYIVFILFFPLLLPILRSPQGKLFYHHIASNTSQWLGEPKRNPSHKDV